MHLRATRAIPARIMPDGSLRTPQHLIDAGLSPPEDRAMLDSVTARYAIAIPKTFAALIDHPAGPIGLQVIPAEAELRQAPHEHADPVGDDAFSPVKGIVHRYADRALIKPLLICPVYCRFCFRREHVGPDGGLLTDAELETALTYLRNRPELREVIITGGDPLLLSPRRLAHLLGALDAVPHLEILRIHTRVPVADPARLTHSLTAALATEKPLWLVLHANHASEFTPEAHTAIRRIQALTIPILGQSVLLRGVNDSTAALENLFRTMLRHRIKPYYLHHLDPAPGTARFAVPIAEGQALLKTLRGRVTGLAWPTYVLDIPGGHGKIPIGPAYLSPDGTLHDPNGHPHPAPT